MSKTLVFEGGSNIFRYISLLPRRNARGGGGRGRVGLGPRHFAIRRGGGVVGLRRGCREQGEEGRVLPSSRRGCVDVEIERGGGEKPLLTPWLSRSRGEGGVLPSSRC